MKAIHVLLFAAAMAFGPMVGGCDLFGKPKPFELSYQTPAQVEVPAHVKRIAIAEFVGKGDNAKYSSLAADRLASDLDAIDPKLRRFELVDRKRLGEILNERDRQIALSAISDSSTASKVGKIADVQAMIYGTVETYARHEQVTRPGLSLTGGQTMHTVNHVTCGVSVNFTLDDVSTGKTIVTRMIKADFDSDKAGKTSGKIAQAFGMGDDAPAIDKVLSDQINDCARQFVAVISPHVEFVKVDLETGKSKAVKAGNEFAMSKEYSDALVQYQKAIKEKSDDDGAMFNAGLMYEAMADFRSAEGMFNKAVGQNPCKKYIEARKRVRALIAEPAAAPAAVPSASPAAAPKQ